MRKIKRNKKCNEEKYKYRYIYPIKKKKKKDFQNNLKYQTRKLIQGNTKNKLLSHI